MRRSLRKVRFGLLLHSDEPFMIVVAGAMGFESGVGGDVVVVVVDVVIGIMMRNRNKTLTPRIILKPPLPGIFRVRSIIFIALDTLFAYRYYVL